jgi:predicted deacylase
MTAGAFTYIGGRVDPGETANIRYSISETYMGDPVRVPVTIVNGANPGPTIFLSAAAHGDELNGIEVVREVAYEWDHESLHGTLIYCRFSTCRAFCSNNAISPSTIGT